MRVVVTLRVTGSRSTRGSAKPIRNKPLTLRCFQEGCFSVSRNLTQCHANTPLATWFLQCHIAIILDSSSARLPSKCGEYIREAVLICGNNNSISISPSMTFAVCSKFRKSFNVPVAAAATFITVS